MDTPLITFLLLLFIIISAIYCILSYQQLIDIRWLFLCYYIVYFFSLYYYNVFIYINTLFIVISAIFVLMYLNVNSSVQDVQIVVNVLIVLLTIGSLIALGKHLKNENENVNTNDHKLQIFTLVFSILFLIIISVFYSVYITTIINPNSLTNLNSQDYLLTSNNLLYTDSLFFYIFFIMSILCNVYIIYNKDYTGESI